MLNVPLLIIPFALYNMLVFLLPGMFPPQGTGWATSIVSLAMASGATWTITIGDSLVALGLFMLFFEILKATRTATRSIIDHMLSTVLFLAAFAEFLLVPQAATSTFFVLMLIMLLDVIAGYAVSIRTAQRSIDVDKTTVV